MLNLTYSIFYHKNEWYELLDYITICHQNSTFKNDFFIKLSNLRGPHIEFTIRVDEEDKIESSNYYSNCFTKFLIEKPSSNLNLISNSELLFKDFSNNTIYYGIHDYFLLNDVYNLSVHNRISEIILLIFKEYKEKTISSMTEIMIQIFVVWGQALNKNITDLIIIIDSLIKDKRLTFTDKSIKRQKKNGIENYYENEEILFSYFNESLIQNSNLPIDGWGKMIYDLTQESTNKKNNIERKIIDLICENINYESISAHVIFLTGLKKINKL